MLPIEANEEANYTNSDMNKVISALDCKDLNWATDHKIEDADRSFYKPAHHKSAYIRRGKDSVYLFCVETYSTEEDAKTRANQYIIENWWLRLVKHEDFKYLSNRPNGPIADKIAKGSVRCFAFHKGKNAYLVATNTVQKLGVKIIESKLKEYLDIK